MQRPPRNGVRAPSTLESVGGAVPLDSPFYILRGADAAFRDAISRFEGIVLIKGARQMGKTSLLARGLQHARALGATVVLTDVQKLNTSELKSADSFLYTLASLLADQLDLDVLPQDAWNHAEPPNLNFERYLRAQVIERLGQRVVWGLDEVDRLFAVPYGHDVFSLFRAWHNERTLNPRSAWSKLTLAISYATEASLFIEGLNQSPFNLGVRLTLEDFTLEQVAELNRRYGGPLATDAQVQRFYELFGGHPFLVRRGLHELVTTQISLDELEQQADREDGIFGDHLRRIPLLLSADPDFRGLVRGVLEGRMCPTLASFNRLKSAGLVIGSSHTDVRARCQLYARYLSRHLG